VSEPAPRARGRSGLVIVVLGLCGTVVSLMQTLVVPLLPDFPELLDTSTENASWLVTVTLLTSAVATPIVSRLADMYGKRRMMLLSLTVLVAGSVLGALSESLPMLIAARALQGFAPALIPIGISIMRDELPPERIGSGVALMSATLGIGGAVGLPLAGIIYEGADWHTVFWVSAGMGSVMVLAVLLVVPESTVRSPGRFDWPGAVILSVALTALLLGISKGGDWGWRSEATLLSFLVAVLTFAVWLPWELRVGAPMVDIRTSTRRPVLLTNVASMLMGFAMFSNLLGTTQQVQLPQEAGVGFGLSVTEAGLVMLPGGVIMILMAPVSARIVRTYGARRTLLFGSLVVMVGYVSRVFLTGSVWQVIAGTLIVSLGVAATFAAMPILIMRFVPITETASANGLNALVRSVGTSTASAATAALLAAATVTYAGQELPALKAFQEGYWLAAFAGLVAAGLAAGLPRRPEGVTEEAPPRAEDEAVTSGRVVSSAGQPVRQAVVSVLRPDGSQVDWGRADNEGRWSVVLPRHGRYLVVCSAEGWRPRSALLDLAETSRDIVLTDRLCFSGVVRRHGSAVPGALLVLTSQSGEVATTTRTGADGTFQVGSPPTGRYVLTVLDRDGCAEARTVLITPQQPPLELDLATPTTSTAPRPSLRQEHASDRP
jgi:MFS family permease